MEERDEGKRRNIWEEITKTVMRRFHYRKIKQSLMNFRPFLSTSINRVIDIDRIGVEIYILDGIGERRGESAKHCSVPENRDASISLRKQSET